MKAGGLLTIGLALSYVRAVPLHQARKQLLQRGELLVAYPKFGRLTNSRRQHNNSWNIRDSP
jgi:hypothetical protein